MFKASQQSQLSRSAVLRSPTKIPSLVSMLLLSVWTLCTAPTAQGIECMLSATDVDYVAAFVAQSTLASGKFPRAKLRVKLPFPEFGGCLP
jgi:hypothetical protein